MTNHYARILLSVVFCYLVMVVAACAHTPLPSWNDTENKKKIMEFVETVSTEGSPDFVPEEYRIATFDQDGTILVEKPFLVLFAHLYNYFEVPRPDPKLAIVGRQPDQAILLPNQVLLSAYMNYTLDEYNQNLLEFVKTQKHPRFDRPYIDMFYQPMLELIAYLRANNFRVHVVSGSWQVFTRGIVRAKTGLPNSHLIGTQVNFDYTKSDDGKSSLTLNGSTRPPLSVFDGKPINIEHQIGEVPILAVGNSSGDQAMFEYASSNRYKNLAVWIEHDDEEREYVYPSHVQGQPGWVEVSMKNDFATIFGNK